MQLLWTVVSGGGELLRESLSCVMSVNSSIAQVSTDKYDEYRGICGRASEDAVSCCSCADAQADGEKDNKSNDQTDPPIMFGYKL